jgi:hypothetical protein
MTTADEVRAQRIAKGDVFSITINHRHLEVGDVLKIRGVRGEYEFRAARVVDGEVLWIQTVGGPTGKKPRCAWRYFTPDRIERKLRKPKEDA